MPVVYVDTPKQKIGLDLPRELSQMGDSLDYFGSASSASCCSRTSICQASVISFE